MGFREVCIIEFAHILSLWDRGGGAAILKLSQKVEKYANVSKISKLVEISRRSCLHNLKLVN